MERKRLWFERMNDMIEFIETFGFEVNRTIDNDTGKLNHIYILSTGEFDKFRFVIDFPYGVKDTKSNHPARLQIIVYDYIDNKYIMDRIGSIDINNISIDRLKYILENPHILHTIEQNMC